ncbi:hypothetical protein ISS30_09120 [bacterium]|nr:hypothetical protein [FCB group bacterium]MBL7191846.1 hypothetical protein [bacterium]
MKRFLILLFLLFNLPVFSQVRVEASVDSSDYLIGDWITLKLTVLHDENVRIAPPEPGEKLGKLDIINRYAETPQLQGGMVKDIWIYTLAAYDTGRFVIPAVEINYFNESDTTASAAAADSIEIFIHSAGGDTLSAPHDIKPPVNLPRALEDYLPYIIGLLAAALAAGGYFFWKRWRKERDAKMVESLPEIQIDPYERAVKRLVDLKNRNLWRKGYVKDYYSELSEILKEYYEGVFKIPALEMTSEELLDHFTRKKTVSIDALKWYLMEADLVKFAKMMPSAEDCENAMEKTYDFIREVKRAAVPSAAGETVTEEAGF